MGFSFDAFCHSVKVKATEQCFPVVLFITLHEMFLTFESVGENSKL